MELSLIAAKILGTYLIIGGLFVIFRGKTIPHLLQDFFGHPAVVYLTGVILIFLSSLLLIQNNVWDGTWRTLVTLLAWLVLVKGFLYLFFPEILRKIVTKKLLESVSFYGIIAIVVGLSLFYIG